MVSFVWRRGFSSQRQAIFVAVGGISARPWTVTRMPAMVKVEAETGGEGAEVPERGLFVAAMAGEWVWGVCLRWRSVEGSGAVSCDGRWVRRGRLLLAEVVRSRRECQPQVVEQRVCWCAVGLSRLLMTTSEAQQPLSIQPHV